MEELYSSILWVKVLNAYFWFFLSFLSSSISDLSVLFIERASLYAVMPFYKFNSRPFILADKLQISVWYFFVFKPYKSLIWF